MYLRKGLHINALGHLEIGGCDCVELAHEFGTPLYVYDEDYLRARCSGYTEALKKYAPGGAAAYASKAFLTTAMAVIMKQCGMWLDCVSLGELYVAKKAGFPAEHIIVHGSNKTDIELQTALDMGVGRIVLDSTEEIERLAEMCEEAGKRQMVFLRVNPGVDAHTHSYIQTARVDSKFGVGADEALNALKLILAKPGLELRGIHTHLGSQIFDLNAFDDGCKKVAALMTKLRDATGTVLPEVNLGGGFSVHYTDADAPVEPEESIQHVAAALKSAIAPYDYPVPALFVEPGRSVVAEACVTLYTVGAIKTIPGIRKYVSIDGGLADNPRPALYHAEYEAALANRMNETELEPVRISGRSCETDTLIESVMLPAPKRGDILAVFTSGAYQYAMASNYNRVPIPAVVLAKDGKAALMVRRQTVEELTQYDSVPEWLDKE